jgi:hypothetical protein
MNGPSGWVGRLRRSLAYRSRLAAVRMAPHLRGGLARAGVALRRPRLVLGCYRGAEGSGLFSEFRVVLGALAHYERWRHVYAGLRVDYAADGLFYEPAHGPNWWQYYFEPVDLGPGGGGVEARVGPLQHQSFAEAGERLARENAAELVRRHIRPRPHVARAVDAYAAGQFAGAYVVGIHYRGTNKFEEAPRVPYDAVRAAAAEALERAGSATRRIFLATDEQPFLDYMRAQFPDTLLYREMFRSADGRPIDEVNEDGNYRKGEDAVIDCLLLARCRALIRTASNLSVCATLFNPALPQRALNHPYP